MSTAKKKPLRNGENRDQESFESQEAESEPSLSVSRSEVLREDASFDRRRKSKRVDEGGRPLKRMIFMVSKEVARDINAAIECRAGLLFARAFKGAKVIGTHLPEDEYRGLALHQICGDWMNAIYAKDDE